MITFYTYIYIPLKEPFKENPGFPRSLSSSTATQYCPEDRGLLHMASRRGHGGVQALGRVPPELERQAAGDSVSQGSGQNLGLTKGLFALLASDELGLF